MRFNTISVVMMLFTLGARLAPAAEVLDQQYDVTGSAFADSTSSGAVELAQTFTVGVAGTLKRIETQLSRSGSTSGNVVLTVYNTSGGNPSVSRGTASLPASAVPTMGYAYQSFDVSSLAISVSVNEVMAISIKSDSFFLWRSIGDLATYAGGQSKWRSLGPPVLAWQNYNFSHDNGFKTYVDAAAGLPGDFNSNSKVDAADYVVWRGHKGEATEVALNGNGDGLNGVDQGDYTLWRSHFAPAGGSGAGLDAAIPEPGSLGLFLVAGLGIACGRSKRWRVAKYSGPRFWV